MKPSNVNGFIGCDNLIWVRSHLNSKFVGHRREGESVGSILTLGIECAEIDVISSGRR